MATKIKSIYENGENNINNINNTDTMLSATIHHYQNPLVLQQTPKPQKIKEQVLKATNGRGVVYNSIRLLKKGGMHVLVGLFGNQITLPPVSSVINEYSIICSLWGNYNELREHIFWFKCYGFITNFCYL